MTLDSDNCYRALSARDVRFDGKFFTGVTSTGIYCRPICPARLPRRRNCRFFPSAAAAESEGFRPCLRCRPELAPGLAPVDATAALARRARVRIESGALDEAPLASLASELSVSERQVRRAVRREYGASPIELAQTRRLLLARTLLTESDVDVTQVAFCSGFSSVRRFNALFRQRYRMTPSDLRRNRATSGPTALDSFSLRLTFRPPFEWKALLDFLSARAIRGVEAVVQSTYARTVRIADCTGWFRADGPVDGRNEIRIHVSTGLAPVLGRLVPRIRALFDLDADPLTVSEHLAYSGLEVPVGRRPGLRVPGAVDGFEVALRAVLGQQVSVAGASTLATRLTERFSDVIETNASSENLPVGLKRYPIAADRLANATVDDIAAIGIPRKRAECLYMIAREVAAGRLHLAPEAGVDGVSQRLLEIPGIGAWTADYIAMRGMHWPDAFPVGDLGLRKAAARLFYSSESPIKAGDLDTLAEAWRPWRAYAAAHLWRSLMDEPETP